MRFRIAVSLGMLSCLLRTHGQVVFHGNHAENFDGLPASGTGLTWTDNGTIPGWYSSRVSYSAGTGSSTTGSLYSFGSAASTDRGLGSLATGTVTPIHFGVVLRNGTGSTIDSVQLSYTGEQWRVGGVSAVANTLTVAYAVNAASILDAGFVDAPAVLFTSPVPSGTAGAVDGNATGNRSAASGVLSGLNWPAGGDLWIRWTDTDNASSDHGLGVDDFSLTAVPEPGEYAAVTGGALVLFSLWRRWWLRGRTPIG